jgi:Arc/MetJ family transcription regulator
VRTTVDLDDKLMKQALAATKLPTKTALLEEGLRSLLRREAGRQLIAMGGSDPSAKGAPRRRSKE